MALASRISRYQARRDAGMTLPANVGTGLITGRFIRAIVDSNDDDRDPDGVPLENLTVSFKGSVNSVVNRTATPPVIIELGTIVVTTNSDGVLVSPDGREGVRLVATNDEDLSPTGFTYLVTISGTNFTTKSFSISVPVDSVQDLALIATVPSNVGEEVLAWQSIVGKVAKDAARAEEAANNAVEAGKSAYELAVEAGFTGGVAEWLASLKGAKGDKGFSAYEVAVANGFSGSETDWLSSRIGPEGLDGSQGDQGNPGLSAYEVAVANGFVGEESRWLESLVGEPGEPGDSPTEEELEAAIEPKLDAYFLPIVAILNIIGGFDE